MYPVIALTNKDDLHVIWKDFRLGNPEFFYMRSLDGGETWSEHRQLTFDDPRSSNRFHFHLVSIEENLYLIWKEYETGSSEVNFLKSTDNGQSWSERKRLTFDLVPSYYPYIDVADNYIYIIWEKWASTAEIFLIKSNDKGVTWTAPYQVSNTNENEYLYADISATDSMVYCVWEELNNDISKIVLKKSNNYGQTWTDPITIVNKSSSALSPELISYGSTIGVFWREQEQNYTINYKQSNDYGETWSEEIIISEDEKYSQTEVKTSTFNNQIYLAYSKNFGPINSEIYFVSVTNNRPLLNELNLSKKSILLPENLEIIIKGYDLNYSNTDLTCIIQYKSDSSDWKEIQNEFVNNIWKGTINLEESTNTGNYQIRAKLINPEGYESDWKEEIFTVEKQQEKNKPTGFEFIFIAIAIFIYIIIFRKKYK